MKRLLERLTQRRMSRHTGQWRLHLGHGGLSSFVVVTVLTLAAAVSTQANLLFWILGLLLAAAMLSLAVATFSVRGLVVERLAPPHAVAGQPMTIRYRLSRLGRRMPLLNAVIVEECDDLPQSADGAGQDSDQPSTPTSGAAAREPIGWVAHVGNGDPVTASTVGMPQRRGILRLDVIEISTTFPFGILRSTLRITQPQELVVYPRLYPVREGLIERATHHSGDNGASGRTSGGQDEFYGLREYRTGDNVRNIDWRHSARLDKLITREMTRAAPPRLMILLDLDRRRLDRLTREESGQRASEWIEAAIDLTASLVAGGSARGFAVGLVVLGFPLLHRGPHAGGRQRDRLLHALAVLDVTQAQPAHGPRVLDPRLRPSICIVPGPNPGSTDYGGITLGSADLQQFVCGPATSKLVPAEPDRSLRREWRTPGRTGSGVPAATGGSR